MIDHVTVTYAYLWNCHGGCSLAVWMKQKLKLFQCVREWDFDCIRPFYYTCYKKVAEGFSNYPYRTVKMLEKSCPVVDSTTLSCLIAKTLCEVVRDAKKLLSVDFQRYGLLG